MVGWADGRAIVHDMTRFDTALDWLGRKLSQRLQRETPGQEPFVPPDQDALRRTLRPGDVLLVAGANKLSTAIKYLTQSTWSHAALYVGDVLDADADRRDQDMGAKDAALLIDGRRIGRFGRRALETGDADYRVLNSLIRADD